MTPNLSPYLNQFITINFLDSTQQTVFLTNLWGSVAEYLDLQGNPGTFLLTNILSATPLNPLAGAISFFALGFEGDYLMTNEGAAYNNIQMSDTQADLPANTSLSSSLTPTTINTLTLSSNGIGIPLADVNYSQTYVGSVQPPFLPQVGTPTIPITRVLHLKALAVPITVVTSSTTLPNLTITTIYQVGTDYMIEFNNPTGQTTPLLLSQITDISTPNVAAYTNTGMNL